MIRRSYLMGFCRAALAGAMALGVGMAPQDAGAQTKPKPAAKSAAKKTSAKADAKTAAKPDAKKASGKKADADSGSGKPALIASAGDWGVYTAGGGKVKTCYALAKPKDRQPASLKRDAGYVFISDRPAESVKNEVSFVMGFDVKPDSAPKAEVGTTSFELVSKGANLWVKNPAEEGQFVDALRKGQRLVVKAQSKKGGSSTDTYVLAGVGPMLDRAHKDCQ